MPDDDNPIDDFFKSLFNHSTPEEQEARVQAEIDYAAQIAYRLHMAYIRAGFTVDQAFDLVKLQLKALNDRKRG